MRPAWLDHRWRSGATAAGLALALLSGCSSFSGGGGGDGGTPVLSRFSSLFPGSSTTPALQANAAATGPTFNEDECPVVDIRSGAGTLAVAAKGGGDADPAATDLRYQLSFNQLARQCTAVGTTLVMKIGLQGRVILGPYGTPGQIDVPIRYAVVKEGPQPKVIVTKFKRVPAVVPDGQSNVLFTDVEDNLSFPLPPSGDLDAYVVYVGFDEIGDGAKKPVNKKPAPKKSTARNG